MLSPQTPPPVGRGTPRTPSHTPRRLGVSPSRVCGTRLLSEVLRYSETETDACLSKDALHVHYVYSVSVRLHYTATDK